MSVRPSCDHVAAQLDPPFGRTYCDVRTTERRFKLVRDLVETSASDGFQAGFGIADGVVDPSGRKALGGHHVELRQPAVLDGLRGFDEPAVDNTAHEGHAAQSARRSPHAPLGSRRRDARHARPGTPGNPKTMSYLRTRPLGSRLSPEIPHTLDFGRPRACSCSDTPYESGTTTARLELKNPNIRCGIPLSSNAFGVELT